ncbi:MAG: hemerythrin domain-containing protein [Nanoarchaeota archaeon]
MDNLIDTLRQQHWEIFSSCEALDKFCKRGVSTGDNIEKYFGEKNNVIFHLKRFKTLLLTHLKLEDAKLYPILLKAKEKKIKKTAERYSDEMKLISKRTLSFFETYNHLKVDDLSQNESFKLDLNTVITIIKKRVEIEESELYPLYSKIEKS